MLVNTDGHCKSPLLVYGCMVITFGDCWVSDRYGQFDAEAVKVRGAYERKKHQSHITQESLANSLGVTQGVVGRWLNGHKRIPDDKLLRMSVTLEFNPLDVRPSISDYVDLANTVLSSKGRSTLLTKIAQLTEPEAAQLQGFLDFLLSQRK